MTLGLFRYYIFCECKRGISEHLSTEECSDLYTRPLTSTYLSGPADKDGKNPLQQIHSKQVEEANRKMAVNTAAYLASNLAEKSTSKAKRTSSQASFVEPKQPYKKQDDKRKHDSGRKVSTSSRGGGSTSVTIRNDSPLGNLYTQEKQNFPKGQKPKQFRGGPRGGKSSYGGNYRGGPRNSRR